MPRILPQREPRRRCPRLTLIELDRRDQPALLGLFAVPAAVAPAAIPAAVLEPPALPAAIPAATAGVGQATGLPAVTAPVTTIAPPAVSTTFAVPAVDVSVAIPAVDPTHVTQPAVLSDTVAIAATTIVPVGPVTGTTVALADAFAMPVPEFVTHPGVVSSVASTPFVTLADSASVGDAVVTANVPLTASANAGLIPSATFAPPAVAPSVGHLSALALPPTVLGSASNGELLTAGQVVSLDSPAAASTSSSNDTSVAFVYSRHATEFAPEGTSGRYAPHADRFDNVVESATVPPALLITSDVAADRDEVEGDEAATPPVVADEPAVATVAPADAVPTSRVAPRRQPRPRLAALSTEEAETASMQTLAPASAAEGVGPPVAAPTRVRSWLAGAAALLAAGHVAARRYAALD